MKVLDLKSVPVYPYEDRDKNVIFQTKEFKARVIELQPGGNMPECTMES